MRDGIPVVVQKPNDPDYRTRIGFAPEYFQPTDVVQRFDLDPERFVDGKIITPQKGGKYWLLVVR